MSELIVWELAPSKQEIETYATNVETGLIAGTIRAEDVAVKIAAFETFAKVLRVKAESHIIDFLDKCPKGKYTHLGAELGLKDSQTYDYAAYSEKWAELQSKIDILKAEQKEIEENGKKFERGQIPLKTYKQTYSITLNK